MDKQPGMGFMKRRVFVVFFEMLFAFALVLCALNPAWSVTPLIIGSEVSETDLLPYMSIYEDREGKLTIDDVSSQVKSPRFVRATKENTNFGYTRSVLWVRFDLKNTAGTPLQLYLKYPQPWVDLVELYPPGKKGAVPVVSGDTVPFASREVRDRNIVYMITAVPGESTWYLRFKTTSTISLPLTLMDSHHYRLNRNNELPLIWLLYGVLVGMAVYNLFLFIQIRDRNYVYYVLFITSVLMYIATRHGTTFMYLWPRNTWWANAALSFFLMFSYVWFLQFARSFLETVRITPRYDIVLRILMVVGIVETLLTILVLGEYVDKMAVFTSLGGVVAVAVVMAISLKKGEIAGRSYFIAWLIFLISMIIDYLRGLGAVPDTTLTRYSMNMGIALQVIGFSFGITDRINQLQKEKIEAMKAHASTEEKYRSLVENLNDVVFSLDNNGVFTYISPSIEQFSRHYRAEDIIGKPFTDFIHPDDLPALMESRKRTLAGEMEPFEYRLVDRDGSTLEVRSFSRPNYHEGKITGITGIISNITQYNEIIEKLNSSEEKYRTLVENATEAIFVTQDQMVKFENTNALRASGFSGEELHSRPFLDFIHPDDRQIMIDRYRKRIEGEEVSNNFHFRIINKAGDARWMEISAVSITWEGKPAVLNFMTDITERKEAEEKLRESLKEKEVLLKEIHHRVKNNMQIVSSLLNLQVDYIKEEEDRVIFLESQNRIHTMALIHEKLYQSDDLVRIDFSEYLRNLLQTLMRSYDVSPGLIEVKTEVHGIFLSIDSAIPCALVANEIISNCFKHAFPEGRSGEIVLSLKSVKGAGGDEYVLEVRDNGVGIDVSQDIEDTKTLGIQLIRTLTRQLKGSLNISSNGGTSYTIVFPALR